MMTLSLEEGRYIGQTVIEAYLSLQIRIDEQNPHPDRPLTRIESSLIIAFFAPASEGFFWLQTG